MVKKLAIDWDDTELRLVAAQGSGGSIKVTDAAVIPLENGNVIETLRTAVRQHGLEKVDTLVAIGRGKAELRELKLPPVPDEELPDMVRFQAIRGFASSGESATVDYLVTGRGDEGIELIAAAIGPSKLDSVRETCEAAGLDVKRITLRPLNAAALFLSQRDQGAEETVLIDLLADDAEIVIARGGKVVFVRTVRLPNEENSRPLALAGELRRSLVACGSSDSTRQLMLWGRQSVHERDIAKISEAIGGNVTTINPFALVEVDAALKPKLPEHVGRLAPLVGLLACNDTHSDRLIDFLNPRKRPEASTDRGRYAILAAACALMAALVGWFAYQKLAGLDQQISLLQTENASLQTAAKKADESIARTEDVDVFLDGDLNWLSEIQRVSGLMPPADEILVRRVNGVSSAGVRGLWGGGGGGKLTISGAATKTSAIERMEAGLRDDQHSITGDGTRIRQTDDAYKWDFSETITVDQETIRDWRYSAIAEADEMAARQAEETDGESAAESSADVAADQQPSTNAAADDNQTEPDVDKSDPDRADEGARPPDDTIIETSVSGNAGELAARDAEEVQ